MENLLFLCVFYKGRKSRVIHRSTQNVDKVAFSVEIRLEMLKTWCLNAEFLWLNMRKTRDSLVQKSCHKLYYRLTFPLLWIVVDEIRWVKSAKVLVNSEDWKLPEKVC